MLSVNVTLARGAFQLLRSAGPAQVVLHVDGVVEPQPSRILRPRLRHGELGMPLWKRTDVRCHLRIAVRRLQIAMALDAEPVVGLRDLHAAAVFLVASRAGGRGRHVGGVRRRVVTRQARLLGGVRAEPGGGVGRRMTDLAPLFGEGVRARDRTGAIGGAAPCDGVGRHEQQRQRRQDRRQQQPPAPHPVRVPEVIEVDPLCSLLGCADSHQNLSAITI